MTIIKYTLVGLMFIGGINSYAQVGKTMSAQSTQQKTNTPTEQTSGEKAAALTAEMTELLSLTTEQVDKVRTLNLKVANKIEAIVNDGTMTNEKKTLFINGNKTDHKRIMNSILNDDQMVTYEAWLASRNGTLMEDAAVTE